MANTKQFVSLGALVSDLKAAWRDRLTDANELLKANRHGSAIAFGIYALEILLKTRICQVLKLDRMPRVFEIHDLLGLATSAGLRKHLEAPAFQESNTGQNWSQILTSSYRFDAYRYGPDGLWSKQDAERLLNSLKDDTDGVIIWIQQQT